MRSPGLLSSFIVASLASACAPSDSTDKTPSNTEQGSSGQSAAAGSMFGTGAAGTSTLISGSGGRGDDQSGTGGTTGSGGTNATGGSGAPNEQAGASGMMSTAGASGTGAGTSGNSGMVEAGTDGAAGSSASGPTFHVFLLLGQSNMAGYPKAQDADKVEDERIRVLGYDDCAATGRQEGEWDTAAPPLHECWNGAIGPADHFAKTLIEVLPSGDTIGLVPCAISGERIETFLKSGGSKYGWIVERAKLAQDAGGVIEGILFHQGESNNGDPSWPGKVNTLVMDLKADLGLRDVPFLAGELAYDGGCAGHNTQVARLPMMVSNAHVISAQGLALDPADSQWRLHFGHDAQVTFGERYAEKMIELLGW